MTQTDVTTSGGTQRLHGLDSLRAAALGLGIGFHSLLPFIEEAWWLVSDSASSVLALVGVYWIQLFRMVLFMALAGYFSRMVLHRRGATPFLKDRALRIGLPVLLFWPIAVFPLSRITLASLEANGAEAAQRHHPEGIPEPLLQFPIWHLWFLPLLLQCILIAVLIWVVARRAIGPDRCERIERRLGTVFSSPVGIALAAVPYLACLLLQGDVQGGIHAPTTLMPSLSAMIAYGGAFAVGWFLHAGTGSPQQIARHWLAYLGAAVVLSMCGLLLFDVLLDGTTVAYGAVVALAGWSWTYGLIGAFTRLLRRESRPMRYLADASYWSYLMHLPIVVGLGIVVADLDWPILFKLGLVWGVTAIILLGSYDLLVRSTWIGALLNGRRQSRLLRWPSTGASCAVTAPDRCTDPACTHSTK